MEEILDIVALDGQAVWDHLTLQVEQSSISPLVGPAL
jgi:ABC-type transporter Mla maintaining outer membrane lipid asymmetry ATPase subunit MlaF